MGLNSIQNGLKEQLRKSCRQCLAELCHCSWWFVCLLHRTTRTSSWNHRKIRNLLISKETKLEKFEIQSSKFTAEAWECEVADAMCEKISVADHAPLLWVRYLSWGPRDVFSSLWKDLPYPAHWYRAHVSPAFGFSDFLEGSESWKICALSHSLPAVQLTASCISIIHYFIQNTILEFGRFWHFEVKSHRQPWKVSNPSVKPQHRPGLDHFNFAAVNTSDAKKIKPAGIGSSVNNIPPLSV